MSKQSSVVRYGCRSCCSVNSNNDDDDDVVQADDSYRMLKARSSMVVEMVYGLWQGFVSIVHHVCR